jgi:hypothetical protein
VHISYCLNSSRYPVNGCINPDGGCSFFHMICSICSTLYLLHENSVVWARARHYNLQKKETCKTKNENSASTQVISAEFPCRRIIFFLNMSRTDSVEQMFTISLTHTQSSIWACHTNSTVSGATNSFGLPCTSIKWRKLR